VAQVTWYHFFKKKGLFSVGLDRNIEPARVAMKQFKVKNMIMADIFHLPFKDDSFDIVWNEGVLEHFPEPNNIKATKEMARVSKKNVIIAVPNTTPLWIIRKYILKMIKKWPYGYEESYSVFRLKNLIESADLILDKIHGIRILPPIKEIKNSKDFLSIFTLKLPLSSNKIQKFTKVSLKIESKHETIAKMFGYAIIAICKKN